MVITMNVHRKIEVLREKLDQTIEVNGIDSKEVKTVSHEIDHLINQYYESYKIFPEGNFMYEQYKVALEKLKKITKDFGEFPTLKEWGKYAMEYGCLSAISIEYTSCMNWRQLKEKILSDLKKEKNRNKRD